MDNRRGEKTLRFAVLCDNDDVEAWQLASLQELAKRKVADCALIVVPRQAPVHPSGRRRLSRHSLYNLYYRRVAKRCQAKRTVSLRASFPDARFIEVDTERLPKGRTGIAQQSLDAIEIEPLDFAVRFGFGILSGAILSLPRFGVWSFHHGDPAKFRGQPPGVWEILTRAPTTGAIVQQLNEELDAGQILASANFPTFGGSYTRQLDYLLTESAPLLAMAAMQCARTGTLPSVPTQHLGPIYRKPDNWQTLALFYRLIANKIGQVATAFARHQQWAVFAVRKPLREVLNGGFDQDAGEAFPDRNELPEHRDYFNADPFARTGTDGSLRLYFERLDWRSGKGDIATCVMGKDGVFGGISTFLSTPGHLSYPFVLDDGGIEAILPESLEGGDLTRYNLVDDGSAIGSKQPMGHAVIDPTVIFHQDKYWLFYCADRHNVTLHIRYAPTLDGPWIEHPGNPVKIDVSSARPAGPVFSIDGQLIRPGQTCAPRYGQGIVFHRITTLDETQYAEEPVASIVPARSGRYRNGIHTVGSAGEWLVFDHARTIFSPHEAGRVLLAKLAKFRLPPRAHRVAGGQPADLVSGVEESGGMQR